MSRRAPQSQNKAAETMFPVVPLRDTVHFPGQTHTLHVARELSKRAIREAQAADVPVVAVSQRDMAVDDPKAAELYEIGVMSHIVQVTPLPDGALRVILNASTRVRILSTRRTSGHTLAAVESIAESHAHEAMDEALGRLLMRSFGELVEMDRSVPGEAMEQVSYLDDAGQIADAIVHHLNVKPSMKQSVLEAVDVDARAKLTLEILSREMGIAAIQSDISRSVERSVGASQRDFYLREQLRAIQKELGDETGQAEIDEYLRQIEVSTMPESVKQRARIEAERLDWSLAATPEGAIARTYLEWLVSLPWSTKSEETLDLAYAKAILDERHFGLHQVKERILDFLAVRKLSQSLRGPILCFVGPPGVGKTSVAMRVAEALGRPFSQVSLGGVRDEAEIRGHRRTYIGAQPGRIVKELRRCGASNPVMLLDEIDKLGADFRGDPAAALLEALDPSLNASFIDHYIEHPVELSDVLFIATANSLDTVLPALRDRLEIVPFHGYSDLERLTIAKDFIWPKAIEEHGLSSQTVTITDSALETLANELSMESGVRNLEKHIAEVCRKSARKIAMGDCVTVTIDKDEVLQIVRPCAGATTLASDNGEIGVCHGIGVSQNGGTLLRVECAVLDLSGPKPEILLTGNLGEVMRESALAATTFARAHLPMLGSMGGFQHDVHIHVAEGGLPKDGPSAGLAVAISLCSAISGRPPMGRIAVTGEIGLRGAVTAIGMLREKAIAAARAGATIIIAPAQNKSDWNDVPDETKAKLDVRWVSTIQQALAIAMPHLPVAAVVQTKD